MKFKAAKSIEEAAKQPGGTTGAGVGLGVGAGMGMMLPGMIKEAFQKEENKTTQTPIGTEDLFEKMKKLKELLDVGAITQEEFDQKKAEWLAKL
jgi:membrane protease subunit (stomatin/prohibitin family)